MQNVNENEKTSQSLVNRRKAKVMKISYIQAKVSHILHLDLFAIVTIIILANLLNLMA